MDTVKDWFEFAMQLASVAIVAIFALQILTLIVLGVWVIAR